MEFTYKKLDRYLRLARSGLPTVDIEYFKSEKLDEITKTIDKMLSEWPIVWIRTDTRRPINPLISIESMSDIKKTIKIINDLPYASLIMLNPAYSKDIYSGIIAVAKEGDISFEFVPSDDYRKLSRGKFTPELTCIKKPGHFFKVLVNNESVNYNINREIAINIIRELNEKEHIDKFWELMGKENNLLSIEFDWHRRTGLLFTDLDAYGKNA